MMTTHPDDRGVPRQDYYGEGRQPFDDILDAGWGAAFAAGNVLKYLRRTKAPEHSLESARWYYARLNEMASGEVIPLPVKPNRQGFSSMHSYGCFAPVVLTQLNDLLTEDELNRLKG